MLRLTVEELERISESSVFYVDYNLKELQDHLKASTYIASACGSFVGKEIQEVIDNPHSYSFVVVGEALELVTEKIYALDNTKDVVSVSLFSALEDVAFYCSEVARGFKNVRQICELAGVESDELSDVVNKVGGDLMGFALDDELND